MVQYISVASENIYNNINIIRKVKKKAHQKMLPLLCRECHSNGCNVFKELLPSVTPLADRSYLMVPGTQVICKMVN